MTGPVLRAPIRGWQVSQKFDVEIAGSPPLAWSLSTSVAFNKSETQTWKKLFDLR
jgi:hypothetical protein